MCYRYLKVNRLMVEKTLKCMNPVGLGKARILYKEIMRENKEESNDLRRFFL